MRGVHHRKYIPNQVLGLSQIAKKSFFFGGGGGGGIGKCSLFDSLLHFGTQIDFPNSFGRVLNYF